MLNFLKFYYKKVLNLFQIKNLALFSTFIFYIIVILTLLYKNKATKNIYLGFIEINILNRFLYYR